jgi:hypothetical protein
MDWLNVFKQKCDDLGQAQVGRELRKHQSDGFPSTTVINQVYKNKYPGRTDRLEALVEGAYMSKTVNCPVVDQIPSDQCIQYQSQPYAGTNQTRRKLYKACRSGCVHSKL